MRNTSPTHLSRFLQVWHGVVLIVNGGSRLKATRRCITSFVLVFWLLFIGAYLLPLLPVPGVQVAKPLMKGAGLSGIRLLQAELRPNVRAA